MKTQKYKRTKNTKTKTKRIRRIHHNRQIRRTKKKQSRKSQKVKGGMIRSFFASPKTIPLTTNQSEIVTFFTPKTKYLGIIGYNMIFVDDTINFNVEYTYTFIQPTEQTLLYNYLKSFSVNVSSWNSPRLLEILNGAGIIHYLNNQIITQSYNGLFTKNNTENLIDLNMFQIIRENGNINIQLNGNLVFSPELNNPELSEKENKILLYKKLVEILTQIKILLPTVTELQLLFVINLLNISSEEVFSFMVNGILNYVYDKNMELLTSNKYNLIWNGDKTTKTPEEKFIDRLKKYEKPINKLFGLNNVEGGILQSIERITDNRIIVENNELKLQTISVSFLFLKLENKQYIETLDKNELLLALIYTTKKVNITRGTLETSSKFRWVVDNRTMDYLICAMNIEELLPFFKNIPVIMSDPFKKWVYQCSGIRIGHHGTLVRKDQTEQKQPNGTLYSNVMDDKPNNDTLTNESPPYQDNTNDKENDNNKEIL
jgi:hypothetical protein